jgi:hypothetical protein
MKRTNLAVAAVVVALGAAVLVLERAHRPHDQRPQAEDRGRLNHLGSL